MNEFDLSRLDVVILCGGRGERLKGIVNDRPKPMADMGGRPFLDILIGYLRACGFQRFILCVGYKGDVITGYYRTKSGSSGILAVPEDKPLGTGGAIKNAESVIRSDPFIVVNGDSFCELDYRGLAKFHLDKRSSYSVAVVRSPGNRDGGIVSMDARGKITLFNEKAKSGKTAYINAGVYLLNRIVFDIIKSGEKVSLEYDIFPKLVGKKFYGYAVRGKLTDIGTPERYMQARKLFENAD